MLNIDLERLLSGRPLALSDRSVIPVLAERARARVGAVNQAIARQLYAALGGASASVNVTRVGSVAIVPLVGFITPDPFEAWLFNGTVPDAFVEALQRADASDARSILIITDSPGGFVSLLVETASEIRRLGMHKPIVGIARSLAASGAFWLVAQAGELVASPSSDVGSVGAFAVHFDASGAYQKIGIVPEYVYAGRYKVESVDAAALTDSARAFIQQRVNEASAMFVADLARGRRTTEAQVRSGYGEGRTFGSAEALRRGMVDRVSTLEATLARMQSTVGRGVGYGSSASTLSLAESDESAILASLSAD